MDGEIQFTIKLETARMFYYARALPVQREWLRFRVSKTNKEEGKNNIDVISGN